MRRASLECFAHTEKEPLTGDRWDDNLRRARGGERHYQCIYCGRWVWGTDYTTAKAKGEVEKAAYIPYTE